MWLEYQLQAMKERLNSDLDRLHNEIISRFRGLARSTGQRTRADRL